MNQSFARGPRGLFLVALVALFALAPIVRGEDEEGPTPAQRFQTACQAMPAPSAKLAYRFEADVLLNDTRIGGGMFSATVIDRAGESAWKCSEAAEIGEAMRFENEAVQLRDMTAVQGKGRRAGEDGVLDYTWQRTETGARITATKEGEEPSERDVAFEGPALGSLAAKILFLRTIVDKPGTYECLELHGDGEDDQTLRRIQTVVEGPGMWRGVKALLVTDRRDEKTYTFAFDVTSHALLGVEMSEGEGMSLVIVPRGDRSDEPADDILAKPAKTPEVAAARMAYALAIHDMKLFDEMMHWPSAREAFLEIQPDYEGDVDELRDLMLDAIGGQLKQQKAQQPGLAAPIVRGVISALKTTEGDDGTVEVAFPKQFRNLVIEVRKVNDTWLVSRFPGM